MKEKNGIDPLDNVDQEQYLEIMRDFVLEIEKTTVETAADTIAWLKQVRKP